MGTIYCRIRGQDLNLSIPDPVVANTIDYISVNGMFTDDWKDATKWVYFNQNDITYKILMENDNILPDKHLNLAVGKWYMWLMGDVVVNGNINTRITTNVVEFTVLPSGFIDDNILNVPPTAGEQILAVAQAALDKAGDTEERMAYLEYRANRGDFNGERGPKGEKGNTGETGAQGEQGVSGVYVGSDPIPQGYNVKIDPNGEASVILEDAPNDGKQYVRQSEEWEEIDADTIVTEESIISALNYTPANDNTLKNLTDKFYQKQFPIKFGYIKSDGTLIRQTSGDNEYCEITGVEKGDTFLYSGYYAWGVVWGYYENGTAVELLSQGNYTDKVITITDENIKLVRAWSPNSWKPLKFHYIIVTKESIVSALNYTPANENAVKKLTDKISQEQFPKNFGYIKSDGTLIRQTSGDNEYCEITGVEKGDKFLYSGKYAWGVVWGYYENGTAVELLSGGTYDDKVITITDENIKLVRAWSYNQWKPLKFQYTIITPEEKNYIIVDCYGYGDTTDIQEGIDMAKSLFDVDNDPVTVLIKNGEYTVTPSDFFPYAAIRKDANKISIVGESREGVKIYCYNSATAQGRAIDMGGECAIKNLSIYVLNDGTYTEALDLGHNPYCIHNDRGIDTSETYTETKDYSTVVENCTLYSEIHSPVGAGLHNRQTQIYRNVKCISNGVKSFGALYVHASVESYADNMGVVVDDCTLISKDSTSALNLPNVSASYQSLTFEDIPVSIRRTICVSNGSTITNVSKQTHDLQPDSALNNVTALNYA